MQVLSFPLDEDSGEERNGSKNQVLMFLPSDFWSSVGITTWILLANEKTFKSPSVSSLLFSEMFPGQRLPCPWYL